MAEQEARLSLEERTTINFPHAIIPQEVGVLFEHVAEELECRVRYREEVNHDTAVIPSGVSHEQEVVRIGGSFSRLHPVMANLPFDLTRVVTDRGSRYSQLKFSTTPGYDLAEINPTDLEFMDSVRQTVADYFNKT